MLGYLKRQAFCIVPLEVFNLDSEYSLLVHIAGLHILPGVARVLLKHAFILWCFMYLCEARPTIFTRFLREQNKIQGGG